VDVVQTTILALSGTVAITACFLTMVYINDRKY